jgi:hypothetical protein
MSTSLPSRAISPTVLLYTFLVITNLGRGAYFESGQEPSPVFTLINGLGFFWIVTWWLLTDSRQRRVAWVYDMGLFLHIAWPLIMPYHLLKSRGAKDLLVVLGFVGVVFVSSVAGSALCWLLMMKAN